MAHQLRKGRQEKRHAAEEKEERRGNEGQEPETENKVQFVPGVLRKKATEPRKEGTPAGELSFQGIWCVWRGLNQSINR